MTVRKVSRAVILGASLVVGGAALATADGRGMKQSQGVGAGDSARGSGIMGPGMMGQDMGPGTMGQDIGPGMRPGMMEGAIMPGWRVAPMMHLGAEDVRHFFEHHLEAHGFERLKIGDVKEVDQDTITAEIVTQEDSLVERFEVDRHSGLISPSG